MALQYPCECCSDDFPMETLVLVEYNGKLMCSTCVNDLVNDLRHEIENLKAVHLAIELYNQERVGRVYTH